MLELRIVLALRATKAIQDTQKVFNNMNKHSFFPHASRMALSVGKLILIITAFLSTASLAKAQSPVDLSLWSYSLPSTATLGNGQDIRFNIAVFIENRRQASGVIVTAELTAGVIPSSVETDTGQCSYTDNLITCNLGVVGREGAQAIDWVASMEIHVKPTTAGTIALTARVTASEPDPNLANNTTTSTVTILKSRKRIRFL